MDVPRIASKILLVASDISSRSLAVHIENTRSARAAGQLPQLIYTVVLESARKTDSDPGAWYYKDFIKSAKDVDGERLRAAEMLVKDDDVVNVQFTSGTTGLPKAALLTHRFV